MPGSGLADGPGGLGGGACWLGLVAGNGDAMGGRGKPILEALGLWGENTEQTTVRKAVRSEGNAPGGPTGGPGVAPHQGRTA